jgi:glycosyltransferase involved in cell wall biosynthesis
MRIAQIAPLYESVPPKLYGGTERVVSYLTEALIRQGHQVTLFASGDSQTRAQLIAPCRRALGRDPAGRDMLAYHILLMELVAQEAYRFDILHFHCDYLHYPLSRRQRTRHVTTLHGRLDLPELALAVRRFGDAPFVSISDDQRRPLPAAHWIGTIHHGLPPDLFPPRLASEGYLAFLGRISPDKGPDIAVRLARESGLPLRIAAKLPKSEQRYYAQRIEPYVDGTRIRFVGEIGDDRKAEFLGGAAALLFPIDWPEPFGLVMIEAMACGTPVIAHRRGAVAEVVEHGVTGFVVDGEAEALAAIRRLGEIDRARVRARFEERFTARRMAEDYLRLYRKLALSGQPLETA